MAQIYILGVVWSFIAPVEGKPASKYRCVTSFKMPFLHIDAFNNKVSGAGEQHGLLKQ